MSSSSDYSQWLYENRKYKGGRKEKFPLNKTYHFYCRKNTDTEYQSSAPRNYHVALLDTGELVCTDCGYTSKLGNTDSDYVYIGTGIVHHNEYF